MVDLNPACDLSWVLMVSLNKLSRIESPNKSPNKQPNTFCVIAHQNDTCKRFHRMLVPSKAVTNHGCKASYTAIVKVWLGLTY